MNKYLLFFTSILLVGCAHGHSQGVVIISDHDGSGHVCLGQGNVRAGEALKVYRVACEDQLKPTVRNGSVMKVCQRIPMGDAVVVEVIDKHFSTVRTVQGFPLEKGMVVEK